MIDWSNFNSSVIIEVTRRSGIFTSTGVAVKNNLVLTAAHCLEGEILKVRVFNQAAYDPNATSFEVQSFELHPKYDKEKSNYQYDLAKLQLADHLPESTVFYPVMKNTRNLKGKILRLGFGARNQQNIRTLIEPAFKEITVESDVLQLYDKFSFSGDSGGPVFIQDQGQMYLLAIHSTLSHGPEGRFSYNPLVSQHADWALASLH